MRGQSVSRSNRKLDTVIVAARYSARDGRLTQARAYERRGAVWTDWLMLDRPALLHRLRSGKRVAIGVERDLPGDFEVLSRVRCEARDGQAWITAAGGKVERDDLGVPLF